MVKNNINIEYQKIFETDDALEAYNKEIEQIAIIGRRNLNTGPLLNLTGGGEGVVNYIWTDTHRKNLSNAIKKAIDEKGFKPFGDFRNHEPYTEIEKIKISETNKQFYKSEHGKKRKTEMVEKWKTNLVNGKRVLSEEARKKMSEGASKGNKIRFQK